MVDKNRKFQFAESKVLVKSDRYFLLGQITYIFALCVHSLWCLHFFYLGLTPLGIFNIFSVFTFVICLHFNKKEKYLWALVLATIEILFHQILAVYYLGWAAGFQYFLFSLIFLPFLTDKRNTSIKVILAVSIVLTYMTLEHVFHG